MGNLEMDQNVPIMDANGAAKDSWNGTEKEEQPNKSMSLAYSD